MNHDTLLTVQLLLLCSLWETRLSAESPNIYRWIEDSSYICSPAILPNGSLVAFLSEEEGLSCNVCVQRDNTLLAKQACGLRIDGNNIDFEIGCYDVPPLCLEEYVLRYSNQSQPLDILTEEIFNQKDNKQEDQSHSTHKERARTEIMRKMTNILKNARRENREKMLVQMERFLNNKLQLPVDTTVMKTTTEEILDLSKIIEINNVFEDITAINQGATASLQTAEERKIIPTEDVKVVATIPVENVKSNRKFPFDSFVGQKETFDSFNQNQNTIVLSKRRKFFFGTSTTTSTTTTSATTTVPKRCEDKNKLCCFWAMAGECTTNPFWMRINCAKTCGTCKCTLRKADHCVSTGVNCTLPSTTSTTSTTTTTTTTTPSPPPTSKPVTLPTTPRPTRPLTPPKNGFARTRSTKVPVTVRTTTTTTTPKPTTTTSTTTTTTTTSTTSTTTTTTPDPCQDSDSHCSFWASIGECEKNPFWMRPSCQRSCGSCGEQVDTVFAPTPRKGCENDHKLCQFWSATGECELNPNWMVPHCPLSCLIC